jgi:hypothetical protein
MTVITSDCRGSRSTWGRGRRVLVVLVDRAAPETLKLMPEAKFGRTGSRVKLRSVLLIIRTSDSAKQAPTFFSYALLDLESGFIPTPTYYTFR